MLELKVKDVRETFEETLGEFYAFPDFSVGSTKVMDKDKTFRIEFRIYDSEFWMNIEPAIYCVHIATRSFGEPDHLDMLHIWLRPYRYDKEHFTFGWRKDLEYFFDAFNAHLIEKIEAVHKDAVDRCDTKTTEDDGSNIKIGPFKEDNLMNYLEEEEAASLEEYIADAKVDESKVGECKIADKPSIFNGLKEADEDEYI